jgi:iron-sulfur cluster repair protein YtfE (RIC family)
MCLFTDIKEAEEANNFLSLYNKQADQEVVRHHLNEQQDLPKFLTLVQEIEEEMASTKEILAGLKQLRNQLKEEGKDNGNR